MRKTNEPVVWVRNLKKTYDGVKAVDGVDLTIYRGRLVGILGPNGAGKSTTIRMLYGATPPSSGELKVLGQNIANNSRGLKKQIGVVPEESNLDAELTVLENLEIFGRFFGMSTEKVRKRAPELLRFLELTEKTHVEIDALSHGMKRRGLLARALLSEPQLLILDEPTIGLDPHGRHLFWQKLNELKSRGITQILTTHYMEEAARLCDHLFIMNKGKIIAEGAPAELIKAYTTSEVLEVRLPVGIEESFIELFDSRVEIQRVEDHLLIFTDEAREILQQAETKGVRPDFATLRPANLEDVFLKLTGRRLQG